MLKRVLTGLVAVPAVMALCLWLPKSLYAGVIGAVLMIAWWEVTRLLGPRVRIYDRLGLLIGGGLTMMVVCGLRAADPGWVVGAIGLIAMAGVWEGRRASPGEGGTLDQFLTVAVTGWLFAYVFLGGWYLLQLREFHLRGGELIIWLLGLVWTADSAAYFSGTWYGKRKILGAVSPSKTLEGLAAAVVVPMVLASIVKVAGWSSVTPSWGALLGTVILVSLAAQAGDAVESLLKRYTGAKDSGSWIPGHGGVLDKLDSFLGAGPVMYYCVSRWWTW